MKEVFNLAVKRYLKFRYNRLLAIRTQSPKIQEEVLRSLLDRAKETQYGKKYNFAAIENAGTYSSTVPLTDYDDLKPYIQQMMEGEDGVLWPGQVYWYSKSSGTTSDRSKYIPVSDDALYRNNVASSWDTMSIIYHEDPKAQIFWKKSLIMGGSLSKWPSNPKVTVGDVSAILLDRMPKIGRPFYTPDFETALIDDWEQKIGLMDDVCGKEDVVMFGGVPTWTIVLFQKMMQKRGVSNMLEIWPNARYYIHGGVGFEPYTAQFAKMFPSPDFKYFEVYNASEGYFAVQDRSKERGMLLLTNNDIYYEFISLDELANDQPQTLTLQDVEIGHNYAIVITTSSGLWRYMPGDTIVFTCLHPFRIKVSGRTKHFINVFGEEVMVGNTDKALAETTRMLPAIVSDYTVAPIFLDGMHKGGHLWVIEFEKLPNDISAYAQLLDENLQLINSDYAAKRHKDLALTPLTIKVVPVGTFQQWLASKGKVGGQNKVPRLYNDRRYVDELMKIVEGANI